jgi:hypothetical protein
LNLEVDMGEQGEQAMLPFDETGENARASASARDGAIALSSSDTAEVNAAETVSRPGAYPQAWGIAIPPDFIPATKAQVAYLRELCGAIALTSMDGMHDTGQPTDLVPSRPDSIRNTVMSNMCWELGRVDNRSAGWSAKPGNEAPAPSAQTEW